MEETNWPSHGIAKGWNVITLSAIWLHLLLCVLLSSIKLRMWHSFLFESLVIKAWCYSFPNMFFFLDFIKFAYRVVHNSRFLEPTNPEWLTIFDLIKSNQIKYLFIAPNKKQCGSYINNNIIIMTSWCKRVQKKRCLWSSWTLLMMNKNLFWGASKHLNRCSAKNVQCNKSDIYLRLGTQNSLDLLRGSPHKEYMPRLTLFNVNIMEKIVKANLFWR